MLRRLIIPLMLALLLMGCVKTVNPTVDPELAAAALRIGTRRGAIAVFAKNPEARGDICPVATLILTGLDGDCADIPLKDQSLALLSAAATEWFPDWEADVADIVAGLDALFKPEAECSPEQMLYLRAFFLGIVDACKQKIGDSR